MNTPRKTALVTGATRGIGFGIVQALLKEGFNVTGVGTRPSDTYPEFSQLLANNPDRLYFVQGNIASEDDRKRIVQSAYDHHGRLDLLVNNAGVAPKVRADLLEQTEESMDRLYDINTKGTFFMAQETAKRMVEQELVDGLRGTIINVSSVSATVVSTNRADYCISKASISMITQLFASALAGDRIMVYEIQPGIIQSDMTAGVQEKYDALFDGGIALINRWGTPEDIGNAVCVLAEGRLQYTTGQVIYLDGGMTIQQL